MNNFDNTVNSYLSIINDNEYLSGAIKLILILYAGLAAPQLPEYIAKFFDNAIVKLIIYFLIVYTAKQDPTVAIIAAIAVMVTLHTVNKLKFNNQMVNAVAEGEALPPPEEEGMEQVVMEEEQVANGEEIPEEALAELELQKGCARRANFRNSFYPQYTNMKPDAYKARYTGGDVSGYDPMAAYSSI
jgi:hypothetical protein